MPPRDADFAAEVTALTALLVEMVGLAGQRAVFPSQWALIAELALEHNSVRAALRAKHIEETAPPNTDLAPSGIERIIAQLDQLHDLIGDSHAQC